MKRRNMEEKQLDSQVIPGSILYHLLQYAARAVAQRLAILSSRSPQDPPDQSDSSSAESPRRGRRPQRKPGS